MNFRQGGVARSLKELQRRGWVSQVGLDGWMLTETGRQQASYLLDGHHSKPAGGG
jgi:Mn-dependent DtxR family transcriptional regulator